MRLECPRVMHEALLCLFFFMVVRQRYGRIRRWSRIRAVHLNNIGSLSGIRGINGVLNARIKGLCLLTKGVDERIGEGLPR